MGIPTAPPYTAVVNSWLNCDLMCSFTSSLTVICLCEQKSRIDKSTMNRCMFAWCFLNKVSCPLLAKAFDRMFPTAAPVSSSSWTSHSVDRHLYTWRAQGWCTAALLLSSPSISWVASSFGGSWVSYQRCRLEVGVLEDRSAFRVFHIPVTLVLYSCSYLVMVVVF